MKERQYAEEVGMVLSQMGLPPAFGKLLGWLLICDPPSQTITELSNELGLSKGSVSTGMRMLERSGMVQRVPAPGRGHAYELVPDAFIQASNPASKFGAIREAMDKGLAVLGDPDAPRAQRLRIIRDFYAFVAVRIPELMDEFRELHMRKD